MAATSVVLLLRDHFYDQICISNILAIQTKTIVTTRAILMLGQVLLAPPKSEPHCVIDFSPSTGPFKQRTTSFIPYTVLL